MSLNEADIKKRVYAYEQIESDIQGISRYFKSILIWNRSLSIHQHSGEKEIVKKLIGEMVDLSICYEQGKADL